MFDNQIEITNVNKVKKNCGNVLPQENYYVYFRMEAESHRLNAKS